MNEPLPQRETRRRFIQHGVVAAVAGLAGGNSAEAAERANAAQERALPNEELMCEHGVLNRVLIIYQEVVERLGKGAEIPPEAVHDSAEIVRSYIEDYHEKLEQDFLFPRFIDANKMKDLVQVLLEQHLGGRNLTDITLHLATAQTLKSDEDRARLIDSLRKFIRMYHAHEAREDTVLFPAFRSLVSAHEYSALREDFAKRERELFGSDCFPEMVDRVGAIERKLGIAELSRYTEGF